jgi:PAS domain S-box-containing protein
MTKLAATAAMMETVGELRRCAGPLFAAVERSGLAMLALDPRRTGEPIVYINEAFTTLSGFRPEDVLGDSLSALNGPATDPKTIGEVQAALREGRELEAEILHYRKDGVAFWNNLFVTPVPGNEKEALFFLVTAVDVSTVRQARLTESLTQTRQRQLDEVNERLRIALSLTGAAAAWEWYIDRGAIVGDARFAALYGLTLEEATRGVTPKTFFALIHSDDRARIRLAIGAVLRGAEVFSKEYRLLLADGTVRWVHARGRCHYDKEDQPSRFSGTMVDITDQKRIEERLRIAQTAGGIGTFEYIDGFATVAASPQFCNLLGLHAAPELPIRTINGIVQAGDPPIIEVGTLRAPGSTSRSELQIVRPVDGEPRWIMRCGEYLRDTETAGLRFVGVIYDITNAKRTEAQLRRLNETLESRITERTRERDRIWQVSRDLYMLCDMDGVCKSTNPAWQSELAIKPHELIERSIFDFVHPEDRATMRHAVSRLSHGQFVESVDVRMISGAGHERWYSWTGVPEGDRFFAAGRDVTHRNELEEQLRQAQKMEAIGQLTGGIAHDFNNLLTGISGSLELLQLRLKQGRVGDVERYVNAATTSASRAAALTHRLLAFSRRQPLNPRAVAANQLIVSMEDMLRRTLGEGVEVELKLAGALWLTSCDPNQLENALLNLAINARDAMPDGGKLTIETTNIELGNPRTAYLRDIDPGQYVCLRVSDTGTGMSADVAARAFDPFFTTKPMGQGTGLGLSMIYGFARQSGGFVSIDTELGRGTTIKLYLPHHVGDADAPERQRGEITEAHRAAGGEVVLVVEDEQAVRDLVVEVLSDLGYRAIQATDGLSGLKILESDDPIDLLVTDVGLPGMNGRQLAEAARTTRPDLKILFMTGYAETSVLEAGFIKRGMDMITKPFAIDTLAASLRNLATQP